MTSRTAAVPSGEAHRYGRDFRLYATGRAVSVVGDRVAVITLVFLILKLTHNAGPALALFYAARVVPTFFAGLLVGVVVDHFDRRRLMLGCDLSRAVLLAAVPSLAALSLAAIYPLVLVLYGLTLLFSTAAAAAVPDVVVEDRLQGANGVLNAIDNSADIAYAFGGALVFALGLRAPFYIDAATFLFSATMIYLMRIPGLERGPLPDIAAVRQRIRGGFAYIGGHPFLRWSTIIMGIAPLAGGAAFVLAPIYAGHELAHSIGLFGPLHNAAFRFSLLEVALGLGGLLGSTYGRRFASRWPAGWVYGAGLVGTGLADALLAFTGNLYLAVFCMAASGLFFALFIITGSTLAQSLTPSEMRGRVIAARVTVINGALLLGSVVGGAALTVLPVRTLWLIEGAVIIASSLIVWLQPGVRGQP